MHDRFEKEVQKKMEELNFTPSVPVWEKVELEIRPEKVRRRIIFWLFFALLFLGGGFLTYTLFQSTKQSGHLVFPGTSNNATTQTTTIPSKQKTNTVITGKQKENVPEAIKPPVGQKLPTSKTKDIVRLEQKKTNPRRTITGDRNTNSKDLSTRKKELPEKLQPPAVRTEILTKEKNPEAVKTGITAAPKPKLQIDNPSLVTDTIEVNKPIALKDSVATPAAVKQTISTDTAAKKKIAANSKWKKKIDITVGSSSYGSISLFKGYAMYDASASPSPVMGSGNGVVRRPSDINQGLAYSVGFSLARKINEHLEVSFGLQYAQYSTTMNVGSRRNNAIGQSNAGTFTASQYYTNTNANMQYTNRFHAVELPVTVSYKPVLKWPVLLSAGTAYGQLLSTNALIYNSLADIYYEDKNSYVHQMLPLFTSIEAELFAKKKLSFRIGPSVQYNLLKLKKAGTGDPSHLVFAGVKTALIF
jgi:hypothetical protein